MLKNPSTVYLEFFVFFSFEFLMIAGYFIFSRYSRNHGGVFDRRIDDRRSQTGRGHDRRFFDLGFEKIKIEPSGMNEILEIETDRRLSDRRRLADRRNL